MFNWSGQAGRGGRHLPNGQNGGAVISAVPVTSFSATKLAQYLQTIGLGSWTALVNYGVDGYRVIYRTITVDGRPATASGLVVLPRRSARSLRAVEFGHGTEVPRRDAPSVNPESDGRLAGLVATSAGFAAVPDCCSGLPA